VGHTQIEEEFENQMELYISEEQDHVIRVATNSTIKPLLESGNVFPTVFAHDPDQVRFFVFELGALDELRILVRSTLAEKCPNAVAYAFAYDSSFERDGKEVDALIVESADAEDDESLEFAVIYDRTEQSHGDKQFLGRTDSLLR